jgi:hypothetical protein
MLLRMTLTLDPGGTIKVDADQRDQLQWELWARQQRIPLKQGADDFPAAVNLARLAYTAATRAGQYTGTWAEFMAAYADVDVEGSSSEPPDPTLPARSPG